MSDAALIFAVTATAYVSTNLDNLIVLTLLLSAGRRRAAVIVGHVLVASGVIGVGWLLAEVGSVIPVEAVGLLGLVPLGIGVAGLIRGAGPAQSPDPAPGGGPGAVIATLVPLCGDSLAVVVPLLAESPARLTPAVGLAWGTMALLWIGLALVLQRIPGPRRLLGRVAHRVMPLLLIAVGLYVLADTPTDLLVGLARD
jgi:cadmium resistance protein CadD (predicted permease)